VLRESAWDIILEVILISTISEMKTEKKYPTSKNISKIIKKKRRRMRGRNKKIARRRIKRRGG
jgi:hypothetical protein